MPAAGVGGGIPDLVFGHTVAVSIADREQARQGKALARRGTLVHSRHHRRRIVPYTDGERRPERRVSRTPASAAVHGADLQIVSERTGHEAGLGHLRSSNLDHRARRLIHATHDKMPAIWVACRIPQLIGWNAVAIGVTDREQAG